MIYDRKMKTSGYGYAITEWVLFISFTHSGSGTFNEAHGRKSTQDLPMLN